MLLFVVYLFLIGNALVDTVVNALDECWSIIEAVGDFIDVVDSTDNSRRRSDKEDEFAGKVEKKLETCGGIIEAVDAFRDNLQLQQYGLMNLTGLEKEYLDDILNYASKKMGTILYVASDDGDAASDFHTACDSKGPTIVIAETTTGAVFGGYTDVSWTSGSGYKSSSTSFIFQLRPQLKQYKIKTTSYAVRHDATYGPTFGNGFDFTIRSGAMSNMDSYVNSGSGYIFPKNPSYELNNGVKNFKLKEYFVAEAINL